MALSLGVENVTTASCNFAGEVALSGSAGSGGSTPIAQTGSSAVTVSSVIAPRSVLDIGVTAPPCPNDSNQQLKAETAIASLDLSVGAIALTYPVHLATANCPLTVAAAQSVPRAPTTSSVPELNASLSAAGSAQPGTTYDFTVSIGNPAPETVHLPECPNYIEGIKGLGLKDEYQLNCGSGGLSIGAGQSMRFAMEVQVPSSLVGPTATLYWGLEGQAMVTAQVTVS